MNNTTDFIPYGIDQAPTRKRKKKLDRLTRDVLAAEAAGTSYGKWKAQHPHTGEDEPTAPDPDKHLFKCLHCGAPFVRRTAHPIKFCSDDCRHNYNAQKKREAERKAAKG